MSSTSLVTVLGTAEVESALVSHPLVAEAAVVGFPHDIKGEGIYAYVILKANAEASADTVSILRGHVRRRSGRSRRRTTSNSSPTCPRPAPARSCAAFCARSLLASGT